MIFDFQSCTLEAIFSYPDAVFDGVPRQDPITEIEIIQGGSSTTVSITGSTEN